MLQGPLPAITHVSGLMQKEKASANPSYLIFYVRTFILATKIKCLGHAFLIIHFLTFFFGNSSSIYVDAPTCAQNQPKIYGVAKQEEAQIKCIVDANPQDVDFSWTFNNSAESIDVATNHIFRLGSFLNLLLMMAEVKMKMFFLRYNIYCHIYTDN